MQRLYTSVAEDRPAVHSHPVEVGDGYGGDGGDIDDNNDDNDDGDDDGKGAVNKGGGLKRERQKDKRKGLRILAVSLAVSAGVRAAEKEHPLPDLPSQKMTFHELSDFMSACGDPIPPGMSKADRAGWFCKKWPELMIDLPDDSKAKKKKKDDGSKKSPKKVVPAWNQIDMELLLEKCRGEVLPQVESNRANYVANFPTEEFLADPNVDDLFVREKYHFCPFCDHLKKTDEQTVGVRAFFLC